MISVRARRTCQGLLCSLVTTLTGTADAARFPEGAELTFELDERDTCFLVPAPMHGACAGLPPTVLDELRKGNATTGTLVGAAMQTVDGQLVVLLVITAPGAVAPEVGVADDFEQATQRALGTRGKVTRAETSYVAEAGYFVRLDVEQDVYGIHEASRTHTFFGSRGTIALRTSSRADASLVARVAEAVVDTVQTSSTFEPMGRSERPTAGMSEASRSLGELLAFVAVPLPVVVIAL